MAKTPTEIKSLARSHTETAVKTLASIMNNKDENASARVVAANSLLDRGWGKAEQHTTSETTVRYVARIPSKAATSEEWQQEHQAPTLQ
jgi:hypothetical protein